MQELHEVKPSGIARAGRRAVVPATVAMLLTGCGQRESRELINREVEVEAGSVVIFSHSFRLDDQRRHVLFEATSLSGGPINGAIIIKTPQGEERLSATNAVAESHGSHSIRLTHFGEPGPYEALLTPVDTERAYRVRVRLVVHSGR